MQAYGRYCLKVQYISYSLGRLKASTGVYNTLIFGIYYVF